MPKTPEINNAALQTFLSSTEWFNFELTNHCNIPCIYCDNKKHGKKGYMTLDNFKIIIGKLFNDEKSKKKVIFCGYGEPFLNSALYDMTDYVCDNGVDLTIQTNGKWQLDEKRISSLFKINRISVTIDAVTNEIFKLSRPHTDVNEIFSTLIKLVSLKEQYSKHQPSITAKMNVFAFNKHQAHDFIKKCTELRFDHICLAKGCGPAEVMTTINKSEYDMYKNSNVDIADSLFDDASYHRGSPADSSHSKSGKSRTIRLQPSTLFQELGCFDTATIKWDGTLVPCCWDIDSQLALGNLVTGTLEDIFSTENLNRVGNRVLQHRSNLFTKIPCFGCSKFTSYFQPGIPVVAKQLVLQNISNIYQMLHNNRR